jgi:hypothetical protein
VAVTRAPTSRILAQSAVAVPLTGTTSETTLATITIPAAAMGANGRVVVKMLAGAVANTSTSTLKAKFGGTTYQALTIAANSGQPTELVIGNRGVTNSQIGNSSTGFVAASAVVTSAVDTTASVDIVITGQLITAGDTLRIESYQVILYPKA